MSDKNSPSNSLSYKDAGVDIDAGDRLVADIAPEAKRTRRSGADASLGGFGGTGMVSRDKLPTLNNDKSTTLYFLGTSTRFRVAYSGGTWAGWCRDRRRVVGLAGQKSFFKLFWPVGSTFGIYLL